MQLAQRLDNTHGNLSAIGNQNFIDPSTVHGSGNDSAKIQKERQPCQIVFPFLLFGRDVARNVSTFVIN